MATTRKDFSPRRCPLFIIVFLLVLVGGLCVFAWPVEAELNYGTAYDDIGTFQSPWGNWCFWIGWDATFSESYTPTNETYASVVYFAPEAIYVALQSGKGLYSAVNVNVGLDYFYGGLKLATATRFSSTLPEDDTRSITISTNGFSPSGGVPGTGPFAQLSFAISSGITFIKEKNTGTLRRGIQQSYGLSLALDLIKLPLPLSVSLGIDCEAGDPPELCQFVGFYPILIWDLPENTTQNPIDLMVSKLESDTSGPPPSQPQPNSTRKAEELLLEVMRIIQASQSFREFVQSESQNSQIDGLIDGAQDWLDSGDTSHLNLPQTLYPPDPSTLHEMRSILPATQMAFELAYTRPVQDHTIYADCVTTVHCAPGQVCRVSVTAEEVVELINMNPPVDPVELNGVWVRFDTSQESYITHDTFERVQMKDGNAIYDFLQNTDTPVLLGVSISRYDLPPSIRNLQDKNLELCRRYVVFDANVLSLFAASFSLISPAMQCDFDGDGDVDGKDLAEFAAGFEWRGMVANKYGKTL
ncbi:MAG: hypothetical protein BBJ57_05655 [Desulfobacterales bacterium PC51MH44]|nr:MAG: hypothetical protein BBJ57_05655 [Desulfobacterales bacterium PC51MH44]